MLLGTHEEENAREQPKDEGRSDMSWEAEVGSSRITIDIPQHIVEQARTCTRETRMKLAGALAVETLQKHSPDAFAAFKDPVAIWNEIRDRILDMLQSQQTGTDDPQKTKEAFR